MIMEEESKTQTQKYYTTTFTSSLLMKNFDYMYHKEIVEKYEGNFKKIKTINNEDLVFLEILGEGGFGEVIKIYNKRLCEFKAGKRLPISGNIDRIVKHEHAILKVINEIAKLNPTFSQSFFLEYDTLSILKDEKNHAKYYLLLMENGLCSLSDIISGEKKYTNEETLYVLNHLVSGLALLQKNGIANRDIKPENIILVQNPHKEDEFYYKISDFGIGCCLPMGKNQISMQYIYGCTKAYAASLIIEYHMFPLKFENKKYNPFVTDVFSLGMIVLKMLFGKNKKIIKNKIFEIIDEKSKSDDSKENQILCQLLMKMLVSNELDFIDLQKEILKFNDKKIIKPTNELMFYEHFLQEKIKKITSFEESNKLYKKYYFLFEQYMKQVWDCKLAKLNLDICYKIITEKYVEKIDSDVKSFFDMKKMEVKCWLGYLFFYHQIHDIDNYTLYRDKCYKTIQNFPEFAEECENKSVEIINYSKNCEEIKDKSKRRNLKIIANFFFFLGTYGKEKQEEYYCSKSLNIRKKLYGENHSDTAASYNSLGMFYHFMGNFEKSEEFYKKSLEIRLKLFGENHSETAHSYNTLGFLYKELGKLEIAEEFYTKSLNIRNEIYGEKHQTTITSYNNLAFLYQQLKKFDEAEEFHRKSLTIQKELYGEKNSDTAVSYRNLGMFYDNIGKFEKAEEFYINSLNIQKEIYGEKHWMTDKSYYSLGALYNKLGKLKKAEEFYLKSLNIRKELYNGMNDDTATCYDDLGLLYDKSGQFEKVEEFYIKSLNIRKHWYGEKHPKTVKCFKTLAIFYCKLKKFEKANEIYEMLEMIGVKEDWL